MNVDVLSASTFAELDDPVGKREQRVIGTLTNIQARVRGCTTLTNENRTGGNQRAIVGFHAKALSVRVATVAGRAATFCFRHGVVLSGVVKDQAVMLVTWTVVYFWR